MGVTVRRATPEDVAEISEMHRASIEGIEVDVYDDEQVAAWADEVHPTEYPIEDDSAQVLVAENDDIVGFGWIEHSAGDYFESVVDGELVGLYVSPDAAREGVGARLYEALESRARGANLSSLGTWATRNAVPFYEKQGFDRVTTHTHVFDSGLEATVVEIRKDLE